MNKFIKILSISLLSAALLVGCNSGDRKIAIDTDNKISKPEVVKFTQKEEEIFVKDFSEKVLAFEDSTVLIHELEENIEKLSIKEAQKAVDGLMYVMYNEFYKTELNEDFKNMANQYISKGVDLNNVEQLNSLEDKDFAVFIKDKLNKGYYFPTVDNKVSFQINYKKLIEKFSKYMGTDIIDLMNFYHEEGQDYFLNTETKRLNLEVVSERLLNLETLVKKHSKSSYLNAFQQSYDFYSQLYFGAADYNYIYDGNLMLLPEVKSHMQDLVKSNPDTNIAKNINKYLEKMSKSEYIKNDDIKVFLIDLTNVDSLNYNEDSSSDTFDDTEKYNIEDTIENIINSRNTESPQEKTPN